MNSENSKTTDSHGLFPNLSGKINLKGSDEYIALSNLNIFYTWTNIKKLYKNNKFKKSIPTWNHKFKLPDGSNSVLNIQVYFNIPGKIYVNEIKNRITCKIKTGY